MTWLAGSTEVNNHPEGITWGKVYMFDPRGTLNGTILDPAMR